MSRTTKHLLQTRLDLIRDCFNLAQQDGQLEKGTKLCIKYVNEYIATLKSRGPYSKQSDREFWDRLIKRHRMIEIEVKEKRMNQLKREAEALNDDKRKMEGTTS